MEWLKRLSATDVGPERDKVVAELALTKVVKQRMDRLCFTHGVTTKRLWIDDAVQDVYVHLLMQDRTCFARFDRDDYLFAALCADAGWHYCKEFKNSRWLGDHLQLTEGQEKLRVGLEVGEQMPLHVDTLDAMVPNRVGEFAMPKHLWLGLFEETELRHKIIRRELAGKRYHRTPCNEHLEFGREGCEVVWAKCGLFGYASDEARPAALVGVGLFESNKAPLPVLILPLLVSIPLCSNKQLRFLPGKLALSSERIEPPYPENYLFGEVQDES